MITSAELKILLLDIESDRVERTESVSDKDKFCEAICAFANDLPDHRLPGYLVLGVNREGRPTGASITDQLLQDLASHRTNGQIIPMPVMNVGKVEIDDSPVAVVEVHPSSDPPVRYKGRTHIRVGPRRALAMIAEERVLSERRVDHSRTWDARACRDATLDDLALDIFKLAYLPNAVSREIIEENERTIQEQLSALRLFDPRGGCPTNAAVLLLGKDPLAFFAGAYVQYVHYDGVSQGADILGESRFSGDLLGLLRELDLLAQRISDARPVRRPDLTDVTRYVFPPIALHEVFMNAVIHRNYDGSTTPVLINRFADRIEVHNPGSLYGDLTRSQFPRGVSYRNPILAEAAKTLGFVNRFGRGIAKAEEELQRNGNPRMHFDIGDNHFAVVLRIQK